MDTNLIIVENLQKMLPRAVSNGWNGHRQVLTDVTFSVKPREFVSIFGPNGAGKTTLIRILAGLEPSDGGQVVVDGKPPADSAISRAIVFQDYALFDWKTVRENVEFGLKAHGMALSERRDRAQHYIGLVGLTGREGDYPADLSGGLKQRAAIARALALEPRLLLLDEPFAALDVQVRQQLQMLLLELWERDKRTVLFVTHDPDEAAFMSDRVLVLSHAPGTVVKDIVVDLPRSRTPAMRFDGRFQDYVNELRANGEDAL